MAIYAYTDMNTGSRHAHLSYVKSMVVNLCLVSMIRLVWQDHSENSVSTVEMKTDTVELSNGSRLRSVTVQASADAPGSVQVHIGRCHVRTT